MSAVTLLIFFLGAGPIYREWKKSGGGGPYPTWYQRYFWGVTPQRGGDFSTVGPKKLGYFSTLSAPRIIFEHFFEIFVKFVNKNAIKSDFWGDLCRSISKIFEKSSFLAKKYFYKFRNFRKYFYRVGVTPLPKNRSGGYALY